MEKVVMVGASGLAREVLSLTRRGASHVVFGVLDDGWADMADSFAGVPVLGPIERAIEYVDIKLLVCVGSGAVRENIVERLAVLGVGPASYTSVLDPTVSDHGHSLIGPGSIILANTVLTTDVTVGSHVVIMPNVTVTHGDAIEDFATIASGVALGGEVRIGRGAYIGMNASVRQRVDVGAYSVLGMGAALLVPLPEHEVWAGVPAGRLTHPVSEASQAQQPSSTEPTPERSS
jgi:sugar O-acyltransferase (sialic acid O-acetyltransferase NeuD family)